MPMSSGMKSPSTRRAHSRRGGRPYRLSVEQYHRMIDAGILRENNRVELLNGLLVFKMSKNPPHNASTNLVQAVLLRIVPAGWFVEAQNPVTVAASKSEPEPDVKVVRGTPRDYANRNPTPGDVGLVVEVAWASIRADRTTKKKIYARAAIPVYWIVNLRARRLEVYTDPTGPDPAPDYRSRAEYGPDDEVPIVLDGREVARVFVRDFLP
jgi:Uma2 family endonuclease